MNIEQIKDNFRNRFGAPLGKEAKVSIKEGSDTMLVGYNDIVDFLTSLQAEHEREMGELIKEILQPPHFMFGTPTGENTIEMKQAVDVLKIKAIATRRGLLKEVTGAEK